MLITSYVIFNDVSFFCYDTTITRINLKEKIMLQTLLMAIEAGSERNTLCFDEFASAGEFTRRLLVLMKYISIEKDDLPPLEFLYVSRMAFRQALCWPHNPRLDTIISNSIASIKDEGEYYMSSMGIDIIISDDLGLVWEKSGESFGNIMHVYTEDGCSLEMNDRELVIGVSADYTNVMLGSF